MKYFVRVGDREYECSVEIEGDATFVSVDGKRYRADLDHVATTESYSLLVEGRSFEFSLHDGGEQIELLGAAGRFRVCVEDERVHAARAVAGKSAAASGPHTILSIMPGIVREVCVAPGDAVRKGQPLLILEAMKMQNEIRADRDGCVKALHVEAGSTVEKAAPLLDLA